MLSLLLAAAFAVGTPAADAPAAQFTNDPFAVVIADSTRSDEELRETVIRHAAEVRHCYETEGLKRDPQLNGTLELQLTIRPTGVVDSVAINQSQAAGTGMNEVSHCVAVAARNWRFERGPFDTEQIVFPFHLSPDKVVDAVSDRRT